MELNKIHNTDCLSGLKALPDECVDCVVTSPPYWGLRDYGTEGQLGLEPTFQEYINKLCDIFDEVKRVLKKEGTVWVNLGDTYGGGIAHSDFNTVNRYTEGGPWKTEPFKSDVKKPQEKSLLQIPSRFAIEMSNRGWILRNEIIWHKRNCMPASVEDRFTVDFEKVFLFVKSKKYFFEQQFEEYKTLENRPFGIVRNREFEYQGKYKVMPPIGGKKQTEGNNNPVYSGNQPEWKQGRNKRCVWTINTDPFVGAHFAVFPEALIEPMIAAGCPKQICTKCGLAREKRIEYTGNNLPKGGGRCIKYESSGQNLSPTSTLLTKVVKEKEDKGFTDCGCKADWKGGVVLDPFMGSGTTAAVAKKQGKQYIGFELNAEYIKIAEMRLKGCQGWQFKEAQNPEQQVLE